MGCGQSFGDMRWQLTWTLCNGLMLPPVDTLTVLVFDSQGFSVTLCICPLKVI